MLAVSILETLYACQRKISSICLTIHYGLHTFCNRQLNLGKKNEKTVCVLATLAAFAAAPVMAGSLSDPIVDPVLIVNETTASSSSGTAIVLLLALLIAIPDIVD